MILNSSFVKKNIMKKIIISVLVGLLSNFSFGQIVTDTVSIGAGYINQVWYSLENDNQGLQSKDNWDIAFEITGYSASILANTQKTNFGVYQAPYAISDFNSIDTSGISSWKKLHNSDTTWSVGAFNESGTFVNPNYLGWGLYDFNTHIVTGDSCYVIKLSPTVYVKFKIDNLSGGIYNCTYSNIDGSNSQTIALDKANFTGKNFAYFNLTTHEELDREPLTNNWDLTFSKYIAFVQPGNVPYPVTGILANKGVKVAQLNDVINPTNYTNFSSETFETSMSVIGNDWKTLSPSFTWQISNDTIYFIKDKEASIWRLQVTNFGGSASGNFVFNKEKISSAGIENTNESNFNFTVYPNPSNDGKLNIILDSKLESQDVNLSIIDINGHLVYDENVWINSEFSVKSIQLSDIQNGIYLVKVETTEGFQVIRWLKN